MVRKLHLNETAVIHDPTVESKVSQLGHKLEDYMDNESMYSYQVDIYRREQSNAWELRLVCGNKEVISFNLSYNSEWTIDIHCDYHNTYFKDTLTAPTLKRIYDFAIRYLQEVVNDEYDFSIEESLKENTYPQSEESWARYIGRLCDLSKHEEDMLLSDLYNLRAYEWVDTLIDCGVDNSIISNFKEFFNIEDDE